MLSEFFPFFSLNVSQILYLDIDIYWYCQLRQETYLLSNAFADHITTLTLKKLSIIFTVILIPKNVLKYFQNLQRRVLLSDLLIR